jgi:nicotinamide mononucleotide transporter
MLVCYEAQLYIETGLQVFYVFMGITGWFEWKSGQATESNKPRNWNNGEAVLFFAICSSSSLIAGFFFSHYTETSQPWLDAGIASFSIGCTLLVVKKIIQNWPLWILIDLAAAFLYYQRSLKLSAALYMLYCLLAIMGWIKWKKALSSS